MKQFFSLYALAALVLLVAGCQKDDDPVAIVPPSERFIYVMNAGFLNDSTGARLSIYDYDKKIEQKNSFEASNEDAHLGSNGRVVKILGNKAYMLMGSPDGARRDRFVVVDIPGAKHYRSTLYLGENPYDIIVDTTHGRRAYITMNRKNTVRIVDVTTLSTLNTVDVGPSPKGLALHNQKLYVCNSGDGTGSTVSVINILTAAVETTLTVEKTPASAAVAQDGKIWVVCQGDTNASPDIRGSITVIDPAANYDLEKIDMGGYLLESIAMDSSGFAYVIEQTSRYGGVVHRVQAASHAITRGFVNPMFGALSAVAFNPRSGELCVADPKSFLVDGAVLIFRINSVVSPESATLLRTFRTQIGPTSMAFLWP